MLREKRRISDIVMQAFCSQACTQRVLFVWRTGGDSAVLRALAWFQNPDKAVEDSADAAAPSLNLSPPLYTRHQHKKRAAFNLTVLSQLIGTSLQPDLTDHILMVEDVAEYMYRVDRSLFHVTSNPGIRKVAGIMLGRISDVPPNDPDFVLNEEQVVQHWCNVSGIPYLGRADIGHDADNKVVPFG
jgi:muramoyltetrapeptide carboxypeptidase